MKNFESSGKLKVEQKLLNIAKKNFTSKKVNNLEIISTIRKYYQENNYILDPHTAVGVNTAEKCQLDGPVICLACAHPAKFNNTISNALGFEQILPDELSILYNLETKYKILQPNEGKMKKIIMETIES